MASVVWSASCDGSGCSLIQIESNFLKGFTGVQLVGQLSDVCKGGLERAKAALEGLEIPIPQQKIIMSLAPADYRKEGSQLDLAFAVNLSVLIADSPPRIPLSQWAFTAELSLDGHLRPAKNMISFAIEAACCGLRGMIVAPENAADLNRIISQASGPLSRMEVISFKHLRGVISWLFCPDKPSTCPSSAKAPAGERSAAASQEREPDFDDMVLTPGLDQVARVLATGLHSLILYGCPGTGKSMFAERLSGILPPLDPERHLEALKIHSSADSRIPQTLLDGRPPYRAPHHQASSAAVIGVPDAPGEAALAHGGILFLDEFPEFRKDILEALREPLETGELRVSRARSKVIWKTDMTLVAACNLCPCGWYSSHKRQCCCPTAKILAYRRRLSGPIMDRIDLHINVSEPRGNSGSFLLAKARRPGKKAEMKEAVCQARKFGQKRNRKFGILYNKHLKPVDLPQACGLDHTILRRYLEQVSQSNASQRSLIRTLRIARTLADLRLEEKVIREDIATAWKWQPDVAAKERGDHALGLI